MCTIEPLVVQPIGLPIGGSGHGASSRGAADDFDREMEDCHFGNPSTLQKPRRHDV
jgi:hypothetical protein